ncbi:MAG TPA: PAS domain S-box protein, partial [Ktedonobacteraceae bacterium]
MTPTIQDTLLQLFDNVRQDPDTIPTVPVDRWQEGSVEWRLLSGFQDMLEQVQQRMLQFEQMEQQLREKEEQYHAIFEATIDGLSINVLEDGRVIEANPALCGMFGYTYEEFIDLPPTATIHPDTYHVVADVLQRVQAGSQFQTRFVALRKDGTAFHAEGRGTPFIYKGKPHLLGSTRDITEQVHAEEQLREREEQYRSIFEAVTDSLTISRLEDGQVVEVNPAACKMLGYSYEELIGMLPADLVPPDYLHLVAEGLQTLQVGGRNDLVMMTLRNDGTSFPSEVHSTQFSYKGKPHLLTVARDITERVRAEEQLREKEAQYRSVFEATSDGLNIADLDGFFIEANPAFCSMLGYTHDELIGIHFSQTTFPEYYPVIEESARAIESGGHYQTQGLAQRKDGSPLPVEAHATPFIYKGKPHMLGVMRDITERVEAEQQIREKEEQYRSVFEATSDGLIIRDMDGYVVEANPVACSMHGYTYEEFIGLHRTDIIDPADHAMVAEYMKAIQAGRSFMGQAVDLRKDGTAFPVEVRGSTFTFQGKPHTLSVLRDITERIQAEQQLREKEEQYRAIFEASSDGLFIIDLENNHAVEVNPMVCQMWGYTYEELLGRPIGISDDTQQIPVHALEVVRSGGQFKMRDTTTRKDGTSFDVEVHATPFTYKGKPHLLAIVRDITEQVQAEQRLREQDEQYRSVFEATSDGLIIRNMEGTVVQVNPAACKMHGYGYEEYLALSRDTLIHPDYHPQLREIIQTVKAGRTFQGQAVDLRKDGSTFPVEFRSDPFTFLGQPHMLTVLHDITERAESERQLREREEQYRSIFEATNDALGILDLEDGHIVEVNPALCDIYGYSYDELIGLPSSVVIHPEKLPGFTEIGLPLIRAGGERHVQGVNLRKDGSVFPIDLRQTVFTYQGKPHMLCVIRDITEQVQAQQLLEQRVEERTRELSSLLEISHTVASTLQLNPLLGLILDQLKTVVDYTGSAILAVEGEDLIILDNRSPIQEVELMQLRFSLKDLGLIWETMISRETIIMPDVRDDTYLAQAFRAALGDLGETTFSYVRACMVVPLSLKEQVIGMLVLTSSKEEAFIPHHAALALAIANQAAVAIENARLYEQAQELAAIEERQRLARELHDSVSQALYGISLGVHTARLQLDRDPNELAESLDYVLELAEAALIEMRALIFELRPES